MERLLSGSVHGHRPLDSRKIIGDAGSLAGRRNKDGSPGERCRSSTRGHGIEPSTHARFRLRLRRTSEGHSRTVQEGGRSGGQRVAESASSCPLQAAGESMFRIRWGSFGSSRRAPSDCLPWYSRRGARPRQSGRAPLPHRAIRGGQRQRITSPRWRTRVSAGSGNG